MRLPVRRISQVLSRDGFRLRYASVARLLQFLDVHRRESSDLPCPKGVDERKTGEIAPRPAEVDDFGRRLLAALKGSLYVRRPKERIVANQQRGVASLQHRVEIRGERLERRIDLE